MIYNEYVERLLLMRDRWRIISAATVDNNKPALKAPEHRCWRKTSTHSHPYREILAALEGNCLCSHSGQVYPCEPGVFFLFDEFEPHDMAYPPWAGGLLHLWCVITGDAVIGRFCRIDQGAVKTLADSAFTLQRKGIPEVIDTAWYLAEHLPGEKCLKNTALETAVATLLCGILAAGLKADETDPDAESQTERIIRTIQGHIRKTLGKGLTLENLGKMAGYSKYHFSRVFKQYAGCTVHEYINEIRAAEAVEMRRRGFREKEIAFELGFASPVSYSGWRRKYASRQADVIAQPRLSDGLPDL